MLSQLQIQKLNNTHHAMIDWLLSHPGEKLSFLAAEMGFSQSWVSIVLHSDTFVEEYTKRRMVHSKELTRQLIEKQLKVALKAYDKLDLILEDDEVDDRLVLDTADKTAKLLGFSPSGGNAPHLLHEETITETEVLREVAPGVLERARERMRRTTTSFYGEQNALPSPEG